MFITFEGIDGSGKSTQIELLKQHYNKQGKEVILIREPGGTELSENIRELLLNKNYQITPESELLLFNAARNDLFTKVIKPALKQDKIILSDRFYDSTVAYQSYGRGLEIETVSFVNKLATHSTQPDITFYLKIDLETSKSRNESKTKDRIEKAGDKFFEDVKNGFDQLAKNTPRIKTINATGKIQETHKKILSYLNEI